MKGKPRKRVLIEAPTFSRSVVVSPDLTVEDVSGDDDFEFVSNSFKLDHAAMTADDIFSNARIRPVYPVFDRDLVAEEERSGQAMGFPALNLASRNMRSGSSSSSTSMSTEAEDANVKGAFCLWEPTSVQQSPDHLWKNGSTGSTRWRILDLVYGRSRSDGNEKLVFPSRKEHMVVGKWFFSGSKHDKQSALEAEKKVKSCKGKARGVVVREMDIVTAHRIYYDKTGQAASTENGKVRRSYLPYRNHILGFFGFGGHFHL